MPVHVLVMCSHAYVIYSTCMLVICAHACVGVWVVLWGVGGFRSSHIVSIRVILFQQKYYIMFLVVIGVNTLVCRVSPNTGLISRYLWVGEFRVLPFLLYQTLFYYVFPNLCLLYI